MGRGRILLLELYAREAIASNRTVPVHWFICQTPESEIINFEIWIETAHGYSHFQIWILVALGSLSLSWQHEILCRLGNQWTCRVETSSFLIAKVNGEGRGVCWKLSHLFFHDSPVNPSIWFLFKQVLSDCFSKSFILLTTCHFYMSSCLTMWSSQIGLPEVFLSGPSNVMETLWITQNTRKVFGPISTNLRIALTCVQFIESQGIKPVTFALNGHCHHHSAWSF